MPICPGLSSIRFALQPELSQSLKRGHVCFRRAQRAIAHHILLPPPNLYSLSLKPKHQRRCCCTSEPKPDIRCVPPSNFSKHCCQWHKQVLAVEHIVSELGGEEWRIYSEITKHFFKAPLLLCNNLLLLFFFLLQINSRERLETPQLTMRGGRKIPAAG